MSLKKIAIVGAGITGLATAILLRLSGYNVEVFSRETAAQSVNHDHTTAGCLRLYTDVCSSAP